MEAFWDIRCSHELYPDSIANCWPTIGLSGLNYDVSSNKSIVFSAKHKKHGKGEAVGKYVKFKEVRGCIDSAQWRKLVMSIPDFERNVGNREG